MNRYHPPQEVGSIMDMYAKALVSSNAKVVALIRETYPQLCGTFDLMDKALVCPCDCCRAVFASHKI
jgi:hypothetical protein